MVKFHSIAKRACGPGLLMATASGALLLATAASDSDRRLVLLPQLRNGATLVYQMHARIDRHVQTRSNVVSVFKPAEVRRDLSAAMRLTVQEARLVDHQLLMAGETALESADPAAPPSASAKHAKVNFTIAGDGGISRADGLDDLDPEQLLAWQFWVAQFAFGWTLPASGVKPGDKWKSEEPEKTPAPIANLVWERETTYVQNEKCPTLPAQRCAVFLVSSALKQKSNPRDATPEDYRLRQLKTTGTATGTNETVAYLSLQNGWLVRATEDLQQSMAVTVAKADDSNQVHYDIQVTSHFETLLASPATH